MIQNYCLSYIKNKDVYKTWIKRKWYLLKCITYQGHQIQKVNCYRLCNGPDLDTGDLVTGMFSCQHFGGAEHGDDDWRKKKKSLKIVNSNKHCIIYIL